jgi:uncharacterized protein (DUF433 family)
VVFPTHPDRALLAHDPQVLGGQTVFAGTRIPVFALFEYLVRGGTVELFTSDYPEVTTSHAEAVLELAREAFAAEDERRDEAAGDPLCPTCRARATRSARGSRKRCPHREAPRGPGRPGATRSGS